MIAAIAIALALDNIISITRLKDINPKRCWRTHSPAVISSLAWQVRSVFTICIEHNYSYMYAGNKRLASTTSGCIADVVSRLCCSKESWECST